MDRISYTLADAALAVGMSERTIADAVRRGDLVAHYPTKRPLILADDLRAWVEAAPTERAS
jgi:hypothetical protein